MPGGRDPSPSSAPIPFDLVPPNLRPGDLVLQGFCGYPSIPVGAGVSPDSFLEALSALVPGLKSILV